MNADLMGLGAAGGAGSVAPSLEMVIKQRLLEEQMKAQLAKALSDQSMDTQRLGLQQQQLAQQGTQFEQSLGQRKAEFGQTVREYDEGKPGRDVKVEGDRLTNERTLRGIRAQDTLAGDPTYGAAVRAQQAGVPTAAIDTMDPEGTRGQAQALERITASGRANAQAASAAAAARRAGGQIRIIKTQDEQGNPTTVTRRYYDDGSYDDLSTDASSPTADVINRQAARQQAKPVMNRLWEISRRINTKKGLWAKLSGKTSELAAKANLDPDVGEYVALIELYKPMIARMVGHSGVLTELDVQSVKQGLPGPSDSQELAQRKINNIMGILDEQTGNPRQAPTGDSSVTERWERGPDGKPRKVQ